MYVVQHQPQPPPPPQPQPTFYPVMQPGATWVFIPPPPLPPMPQFISDEAVVRLVRARNPQLESRWPETVSYTHLTLPTILRV